MDCLCCADGGAGPTTDKEFLGSVCNLTAADGSKAKFPLEPDRYILYVIAGCPFAARPWALQAIYGLPIRIVKLFPASYEDGWFFFAMSDGEQELVKNFPMAQVDPDPLGHHHLKQLYQIANPEFQGAISVPLLWDTKQNTAVSNSSLGLAEMLETQFKPSLATRNQHLQLFPVDDDEKVKQKHDDLIKWIHSNITTAVYKMNATKDGKLHDTLVDNYYRALDTLQNRLMQQDKQDNSTSSYLMGQDLRFADILLWISLLRLDLAYQFRFGLGKYSIREDYPRLQAYTEQIMTIEGIRDTVFPRDIMALYFMTLKWTFNGNGRSLPQVPHSWESKLMMMNK
ncbi:glutathione Stransferase [Seminavis robusta]|uniref:Glutathione Stransferase n=1 Tax=Seminavis robusta TaxID=568900 RepID=A0A9N8D6U1_9STRA|nr:glutathione Stransferase [Seminavis robusta]|eukprot:Sro21_g014830.1 glutathione Stransferase (341) ;mRNA; r:112793-113815